MDLWIYSNISFFTLKCLQNYNKITNNQLLDYWPDRMNVVYLQMEKNAFIVTIIRN